MRPNQKRSIDEDEKNTSENHKHKDSLFVDYFSKDRDWKEHFLSLYNALHGTNLQVSDTQLERVNTWNKKFYFRGS